MSAINPTAPTGQALAFSQISKRFGQTLAVDDVTLAAGLGRVLAIVGENGAGKSTLMKLAYGETRADGGGLHIKGMPINLARHSPKKSIAVGLGMVYQHFMLVPTLTALENVMLAKNESGFWLANKRAEKDFDRLVQESGLAVRAHQKVQDMPVGEQQRLEIIKVLAQGCTTIILDEPTAVLAPSEIGPLFALLSRMVKSGVTLILITHRLREVLEFADDVAVMRHGKLVAQMAAKDATAESLAHAMVGRPVLFSVDKKSATPGNVVVSVHNVTVLGGKAKTSRPRLSEVSMEVRAGEIVGVCGVEGNGQRELCDALMGLCEYRGNIRLAPASSTSSDANGPLQTIDHWSTARRMSSGLAIVPEDRHSQAMVLDMPAWQNFVLGRYREFGRWRLARDLARKRTTELQAEFDVRPRDPELLARGFSGGNQQKLVMAREMSRPGLRALICAQPTRGVDVGAIQSLHKHLVEARDRGLAVLLISADLQELLSLSDRLLVLFEGQIVAEFSSSELADPTVHQPISLAMTGSKKAASA